MENHTVKRGREAETYVQKWLESKGCVILTRNYRRGRGEIDIVGVKEAKIYFFEVKSRSKKSEFPFTDVMTERKVQRILSAGKIFLVENGFEPNCDVCVGFIEVEVTYVGLRDPSELVIKHVESYAFRIVKITLLGV